VNSLARPSKDLSKDWPNISKKAVDHPFPFSDSFSENAQIWTFKPIKEQKKKDAKKYFKI
jgi:thiosulfate dehydrogenase